MCILLCTNIFSFAQTLEVQAQASYCYIAGQPLPISEFVVISGDSNEQLEGIQVTIENYDASTDLLAYNGTAVNSNFDSSNGILTLNGQATLSQYRQIISEVTFTSSDMTSQKSINFTLSGVDFLVSTGHFYQFFAASRVSWSQAKAQAETKEIFGLKGYLTTITSQEENAFILERVSGTAWIGASDENQEGTWRWVTGPEGEANGGLGTLLTSGYENWNTAEPNNNGGNEHYAHMMDWTSPPGRWNDLPNAGGSGDFEPTGYIVEYGGQTGDPDVLSSISGTTILDPKRDIQVTGPISVCPNINGLPYSATLLNGYSYNWTVNGGTIASGQGTNEITVDWSNTNDNASVVLEAISDFACTTEISYSVKINQKLEPSTPEGPEFVCYSDLASEQTYSTPRTPGSDYFWHITNGSITSGDGTNEVTVLWNGSGTGELYFTESTRTATDICDGDSPVLVVDLRNEIAVNMDLTHVSCYQGSNGTATATITSGSGTTNSFIWQTGGLGTTNGNSISNLPQGDYSVDVTVDNCTVNIPFTITEPTELTATFSDQNNTLCHGDANGTIQVNATGGTTPYTYQWSHSSRETSFSVSNLPEGNHSVTITDANGCVWSDSFYIGQPAPLVIEEIYTYKVSCPGGTDGSLEAVVSGGTSPYTFSWETNSETGAYATGFKQGTYSVTVTDANGCTTTGSQIIEEATPKIVLPNAFSPNGDGSNETFRPSNSCPVEYQLTIYNRWGNVIFHTNDISLGWDGTFNGSDAPEGKYSYFASWVIEANNITSIEEVRGEFKLIR